MQPIKYKYAFNSADVSKWKYCPVCGAEILEIYPGDHYGHIMCFADNDSCDIDFGIYEVKDGKTLCQY